VSLFQKKFENECKMYCGVTRNSVIRNLKMKEIENGLQNVFYMYVYVESRIYIGVPRVFVSRNLKMTNVLDGVQNVFIYVYSDSRMYSGVPRGVF